MKKLLLVLLVILLIRLPSLFEPYWYGDEGIYLVLGQAMRAGAVLYRDIWDNKPPLLYLIYAISPTLLWAKLSATMFVLATTTGAYFLAKKLTLSTFYSLLSTLLVGIFLSLPILEGTIANAELYFTLPIVIGAYILICHSGKPFSAGRIQNRFWSQHGHGRLPQNDNVIPSVIIGFLLILAFLIKVPAIFDFMGLFLAYILIKPSLTGSLPLGQKILNFLKETVPTFFFISLPVVFSFFFIVSYFHFNHGLSDFLVASFSQNASYVAIDSGPFSQLSNPLFVKAFLLLTAILVLSILYVRRKISREFLFLSFWFGFSLYGALLSNRPYGHYLLQIAPPAIILFFYLIHRHSGKAEGRIQNLSFLAVFILIIFALIRMFTGAFSLETKSYYANFFDYVSERKSWTEYVNYFDSRTSNNYDIANFLATRTQPPDPIFVWGDNAFIYVLSNRLPITKFIQAHHLTTIPPKNYDLIMQRLERYQPKFIVISRPINFSFPKLEVFVGKNYSLVQIFQSLYVYQNIAPTNPQKFDIHYD